MKNFILLLFAWQVCSESNPWTRNYTWGVISNHEGRCLEAVGGSRLEFRICDEKVNHQWWSLTGEGHIRFKWTNGELSDECVDIPTESKGRAGTKLQLYRCNKSSSMQWRWQYSNDVFQLRSYFNQGPNLCLSSLSSGEAVAESCHNAHQLLMPFFDHFPQASLSYYDIAPDEWMEKIFSRSPNTNLTDIIIPGSHNSATYEGFSTAATTQTQSILAQLEQGIRYLDLRIDKRIRKGLVITHGLENGNIGSIESVFSQIVTFAKKRPKEIIIVDIKEVPNIVNDDDTEGKQNVEELAKLIIAKLGPHLVKVDDASNNWLIFEKIWKKQTTSEARNIVLLVEHYPRFLQTSEEGVKTYFVDRHKNLKDLWPQSKIFKEIYTRNKDAVQSRVYNRLLVSQIIRTPSTLNTIITIIGFDKGPLGLAMEKTDDGYLTHALAQWISDWKLKNLFRPNIVEIDFYEMSPLIPMSIWLNLSTLRAQSSLATKLPRHVKIQAADRPVFVTKRSLMNIK